MSLFRNTRGSSANEQNIYYETEVDGHYNVTFPDLKFDIEVNDRNAHSARGFKMVSDVFTSGAITVNALHANVEASTASGLYTAAFNAGRDIIIDSFFCDGDEDFCTISASLVPSSSVSIASIDIYTFLVDPALSGAADKRGKYMFMITESDDRTAITASVNHATAKSAHIYAVLAESGAKIITEAPQNITVTATAVNVTGTGSAESVFKAGALKASNAFFMEQDAGQNTVVDLKELNLQKLSAMEISAYQSGDGLMEIYLNGDTTLSVTGRISAVADGFIHAVHAEDDLYMEVIGGSVAVHTENLSLDQSPDISIAAVYAASYAEIHGTDKAAYMAYLNLGGATIDGDIILNNPDDYIWVSSFTDENGDQQGLTTIYGDVSTIENIILDEGASIELLTSRNSREAALLEQGVLQVTGDYLTDIIAQWSPENGDVFVTNAKIQPGKTGEVISVYDEMGEAYFTSYVVGETYEDGFTFIRKDNGLYISYVPNPVMHVAPEGLDDGTYLFQLSDDGFKTAATIQLDGSAIDLISLTGICDYIISDINGTPLVEDYVVPWQLPETPLVLEAQDNDAQDVFLAHTVGVWGNSYLAIHVGTKGAEWNGTQNNIALDGKNRFSDIFIGAQNDSNVLFLTDDDNGDALFIDDIFSDSFQNSAQQQSRLSNIKEIRAGAGNDIIDLTSQNFVYKTSGTIIHGGDGNDVIWAASGKNVLFGDDGNDEIVGGYENDVIIGGNGDDTLHGGGGQDIFAFAGNWGHDSVIQLENGDFRLWFDESIDENSLSIETKEGCSVITDGNGNQIAVDGVTAETLRGKMIFGSADGQSFAGKSYADLAAAGAFQDASSHRIFESATIV